MTVNIYSIVIVVLIVILFCDIYEKHIRNILVKTRTISFNDNQFKTGDIILFRRDLSFLVNHAQYLFNILNFFITGTIFTHIGMVVIINGNPYIYHTEVDYPRFDHITNSYIYDDIVILPLETFLMEYPGNIFYHKTKIDINYETDVKKYIIKYNYVKPLGTAHNLGRYLLAGVNTFLKFDRRKHNRFLCTELIVELLQDLKLLDNTMEAHKYTFSDIHNGLTCCNKYEPVILITNPYREYIKTLNRID